MTAAVAMVIVLCPGAPPIPASAVGFSIFIVIGGGAGACCASPEMESAPYTTTTASPKQRVFVCDIVNLSFREETLLPDCGQSKAGRCFAQPRFARPDESGVSSPLIR